MRNRNYMFYKFCCLLFLCLSKQTLLKNCLLHCSEVILKSLSASHAGLSKQILQVTYNIMMVMVIKINIFHNNSSC